MIGLLEANTKVCLLSRMQGQIKIGDGGPNRDTQGTLFRPEAVLWRGCRVTSAEGNPWSPRP